jgi:hypothetical protein
MEGVYKKWVGVGRKNEPSNADERSSYGKVGVQI